MQLLNYCPHVEHGTSRLHFENIFRDLYLSFRALEPSVHVRYSPHWYWRWKGYETGRPSIHLWSLQQWGQIKKLSPQHETHRGMAGTGSKGHWVKMATGNSEHFWQLQIWVQNIPWHGISLQIYRHLVEGFLQKRLLRTSMETEETSHVFREVNLYLK